MVEEEEEEGASGRTTLMNGRGASIFSVVNREMSHVSTHACPACPTCMPDLVKVGHAAKEGVDEGMGKGVDEDMDEGVEEGRESTVDRRCEGQRRD